jgi:hypothetical protein
MVYKFRDGVPPESLARRRGARCRTSPMLHCNETAFSRGRSRHSLGVSLHRVADWNTSSRRHRGSGTERRGKWARPARGASGAPGKLVSADPTSHQVGLRVAGIDDRDSASPRHQLPIMWAFGDGEVMVGCRTMVRRCSTRGTRGSRTKMPASQHAGAMIRGVCPGVVGAPNSGPLLTYHRTVCSDQ